MLIPQSSITAAEAVAATINAQEVTLPTEAEKKAFKAIVAGIAAAIETSVGGMPGGFG